MVEAGGDLGRKQDVQRTGDARKMEVQGEGGAGGRRCRELW